MSMNTEQFMSEMSKLVECIVPEGFSEEKKVLFVQAFIRACVRDGVAFMSQKEGEDNE
jgi:hypothetical protein